MSHPSSSPTEEEHEKFSLPLFFTTVTASLAGICLILKFATPGLWQTQLQAPLAYTVAAFLGLTMVNCFAEYFFHRYVLHKPAIPVLSYFYRQHTHHHNLTRISRRRTAAGREVPFVENHFPITEPEQGEASFFPWYSLIIFSAVLTPLLIVLNALFPSIPWFFGGYAAVTTSLTLYEVLHAIEHWPFETWGRLIDNPRWGAMWRKVYSFHLRHHAVIDCNEAISGFFGLPVADWVFGTIVLPKTLYTDGENSPSAEEFNSPRPCAFIRWCDREADIMVAARRERAATESERAQAKHAALPSPRDANATRAYTPGEKIAHRLVDALGLIGSIAGLTLLVVFSSLRGNVWHIVSFTVFGVALLARYTTYTLHHQSRSESRQQLMRRISGAAIFILIAGTYTPYLLVSLRGPWGWSLFGAVWGLCLAGAISQLLLGTRFRAAAVVTRVVAGGLILLALEPLIASVPASGLWLLLAGVLCYAAGTLFYNWQRLHYHRAVWRTFAFGGSCCHLLSVLLFLLPATT